MDSCSGKQPPERVRERHDEATAIGGEMTANPTVRKLSFTGSTEVGRILMRQSADTIKKLSLELGGNAPFIVFDDADLDAAVEGAIASKYRNAGQTCVCANRFFVHEKVYDAFARKLAARVGALKVGRGTEAGVTQGPLINAEAVAKVEEHLTDAKSRGAQVVTGGKRHALGGTFYEPTVLTGVTPDMQIVASTAKSPRFSNSSNWISLASPGTATRLARAATTCPTARSTPVQWKTR